MNLKRHFLILKVCFYYNLTQPPQVWLLVGFHITMFNLFCLIANKIVVFSWPKVILMRVTWGNTNKMFAKCSFLLMAILLISNRKKKRKKIVLELLKFILNGKPFVVYFYRNAIHCLNWLDLTKSVGFLSSSYRLASVLAVWSSGLIYLFVFLFYSMVFSFFSWSANFSLWFQLLEQHVRI